MNESYEIARVSRPIEPVFCAGDRLSVRLDGMSEVASISEVAVELAAPCRAIVPPTVELVDVRIDHPRDKTALVTGANLRVDAGEVVVIVGAAGVGSSRLVAAALGEATIACGRIDVLGRDVGKLRRASLRMLRRRIGIVPQDLCLLDDRSAQLNVMLPLEIDGIPRSISVVRAAVALTRLGLAPEGITPVADLAASARQRVAVARALVREPELVLADQPTSLQDAEGAELVCESLAEAAAGGAACIVLSRDRALREIAERRRWRQVALVAGRLQPLDEIALDGATLDELFLDAAPAVPNVVPFRRSGPTPSFQVPDENENVA
jgi:ABC-type ATPase involved in cell division